MKNLYRSITLAVLLITVFIITVVILQHVNKLEARKLEGKELLSNLRGYIKVGRIEEAASVLESLSGSIFIDQARFEVAKAYVQENRGEEAIKLLDQISLHDRSFDFQRAVLREKIRGLFSFFFDPAGNLRTPAQLKDFIFHSYYNPDPELIQKNPKNFTDPNQLLDYFNLVIKQMEDILKIEGLKRSAEPALAECYDAIQILLYGRGVIERSELEANLRLSPTGDSERTLYLLGNQYITEADFESSFKTWQKLAEKYPDSDSMKKAFSKTYELFRCRELLKDSFAFWPMDKPDWFNSMETSGKFKAETAEIDKKLDAHQDLALYKDSTEGSFSQEQRNKRDIAKSSTMIESEIIGEDPIISSAEADELDLELERDHRLGWRLQTEFREFLIRRDGNRIYSPNDRKTVLIQTSYKGSVTFQARKFENAEAYTEFSGMDSIKAVHKAASLPVVREWKEYLDPLSENGINTSYLKNIPITEPGFYLITARARYVPVVAVTQLAIIREKALIWSSAEKAVIRIVDRETGHSVNGTTVTGTIEPEYNLHAIASELYDGTRTEQFLSGLSVGFREGVRDELLTDNDDFIKGFKEGLKLRKQYPPQADEFTLETDSEGMVQIGIPDKWKGITCRIRAELEGLSPMLTMNTVCSQMNVQAEWKALFYAERPIVTPGEKIRIKGILRKKDNTGLILPPRETTEFMVWHGRSLYAVLRDTPNERGTVDLEVSIPPSASTGAYHLTIGHKDTKYPLFRVDRTEKPLADVKVKVESDTILAGSTVRGTVHVRRAGQIPVTGMHVELRIYRADANPIPKQPDLREDFFKPVKLVSYPNRTSDEIVMDRLKGFRSSWTLSGNTDSSGNYNFTFDTDRNTSSTYLITARVQTVPDRYTSASAEVLTSTFPVHCRITPEKYYYYPGEVMNIEIETTSLDGKPAVITLRKEITRYRNGTRTMSNGIIETNENGKAFFSVRMPNEQPLIRIGIPGTTGFQFRKVPFSLRQVGKSSGSGRLSLSLDKNAYFPGEVAEITIQTNHPDADILILTGRKNINNIKSMVIKGTKGLFKVSITEEHTPNIFFKAQSVWNDTTQSASVEIPVVPTQNFLKITIDTDKKEYKAGQPVNAVLTVRDHADRPVPDAEISLAAVLSAAYTLQEDLTPDLQRYFWNFRLPLEINSGSSTLRSDTPRSENFWLKAVFAWGIYKDLVDGRGGSNCYGWRDGGGKRRAVGRGGGSAACMSSITAFADFLRHHGLTLFYESRLITDSSGRAEVTFTLPPEGGEFRFTARALTADTYIGEIRQNVIYRSDITVQAAWPMSIREGERFRVPLFIINNTQTDQQGRLNLSSDLNSDIREKPDFTLKAGSIKQFDIELKADTLPAALKDPHTGIQYPLSYAKFTAEAVLKNGSRVSSKAMVPVHARGIPFKETAVSVISSTDNPVDLTFSAESIIRDSGLVTVRMLGTPDSISSWLKDHLNEKAQQDSETARCYAWACEAGVTAKETDRSKLSPPLLGAFSKGTGPGRGKEKTAYYLTFTSAQKRGVCLPEEWMDSAFSHDMKNNLQKASAKDLWALAEAASLSDNKVILFEKIRSRLDEFSRYRNAPKSECDNEYLALGYISGGRKDKALITLEHELSSLLQKRRIEIDTLSLEKASALLLAAVRCEADPATAGVIYKSVLRAVSEEPDPDPWTAALAVHAITEWGTNMPAAPAELRVTVNEKDYTLESEQELTFKIEQNSIRLTIHQPAEGTIAVQTNSVYRKDNVKGHESEDYSITRVFARIDKQGNAELLPEGGKVRIGESVIMYTFPESENTCPSVIPSPGPWTLVGLRQSPRPVKRVLKNWILNPAVRNSILLDSDNSNFDSLRSKLKTAVQNGNFMAEWVDCEEIPKDVFSKAADTNPGIYRQNRPIGLAVRPDRLGSYSAPGVYICFENSMTPAAWTKDFRFTVVPEEEDIPAPEIEKTADPMLLKAVAQAFEAVDDGFFRRNLADEYTQIDLRKLAVQGLWESGSPEAPQRFIDTIWLEDGAPLYLLKKMMEWKENLKVTEYTNREVYSKALTTRVHLQRLASLFRDTGDMEETRELFGDISGYLFGESVWRWHRRHYNPEKPDSKQLHVPFLLQKDLIACFDKSQRLALYESYDNRDPELNYTFKRDSSMIHDLRKWCDDYRFKLEIDETIADLGQEEYILRLPEIPSVTYLSKSLEPLGLKAVRVEDTIVIEKDTNLLEKNPFLKAFQKAKNAEERLSAFIQFRKGGCFPGFYVKDGFSFCNSDYIPRVEMDPVWFSSRNITVNSRKTLNEQKYSLLAQGLKFTAEDGVLRLIPLNPHYTQSRPVYIQAQDDMGTPIPISTIKVGIEEKRDSEESAGDLDKLLDLEDLE